MSDYVYISTGQSRVLHHSLPGALRSRARSFVAGKFLHVRTAHAGMNDFYLFQFKFASLWIRRRFLVISNLCMIKLFLLDAV